MATECPKEGCPHARGGGEHEVQGVAQHMIHRDDHQHNEYPAARRAVVQYNTPGESPDGDGADGGDTPDREGMEPDGDPGDTPTDPDGETADGDELPHLRSPARHIDGDGASCPVCGGVLRSATPGETVSGVYEDSAVVAEAENGDAVCMSCGSLVIGGSDADTPTEGVVRSE